MALAKAARRPAAGDRRGDRRGAARPPGVARLARAASEVAGPGFLNMTLTPAWFAAAAAPRRGRAGERLRRRARRPRRRTSCSSSSRPTPPGRPTWATPARPPTATRSARILAFAGHTVTREYYVNDHGRQMRLFGALGGRALRPALRPRRPRCPRTATTATTSPASPRPCARRSATGYADDAAHLARGARPVHRPRRGADAGGHPGDLDALPGALRRLLLRARRCTPRARVAAGVAALQAAGDAYTRRGRGLVPHHRLRRREGPRAGARRRRRPPTWPPTSPTTSTRPAAATTC